jgi:methylated-DNA-[protein]-cysteine S-methyltransferase
MTTETALVSTPLGGFRAVVEDGVVRQATFDLGVTRESRRDRWGVHDALAAYFDGDVDALEGINAQADHGTEFQRSVWKCLREIRAGETMSYGELAVRVGVPGAARAVGMANASNPIALIVPCHRVIRAGGAIGGYGFGPETKRWLLDHERNAAGASLTRFVASTA